MMLRIFTRKTNTALLFRFHISIIFLVILLGIVIFVQITDADPFALHEPSFGSPGINVNPQNISFNMDSPTHEWEKIDICIYNPSNYTINRAIIKLDIPETFEYKISTDLNSIFHYNPATTTFIIENFGDYKRSTQCDWFEIRPRVDAISKKETINLSYEIEYTYQFFGRNINSTIRSNVFSDITYNISQFEKKSINRDDNISVSIKRTEISIFDIIRENLWVIVIGSFICSILLLIFGPGSAQRIETINRKFRR